MNRISIQRFALLALLAFCLAPLARAQAQLAGDWQGALDVEGSQLHITLHIVAAQDGALTITADNPDQGAVGVKTDSVTFKDSKLRFVVETYQGFYEGTVNADATEITGTWTQDHPVELNFKRAAAQAPPPTPAPAAPAAAAEAAPPIVGDWQGMLAGQLHLILHIAAAADGTLSATLDSTDQGAMGIPVTSITLKDSKLSLSVDAVHGTYEATLNADATELMGTWSQGQPMELNFQRAAPQATHAKASDLDGLWFGSLDVGAMKLRIVFKIANSADGLTAQLQSPDQSPAG